MNRHPMPSEQGSSDDGVQRRALPRGLESPQDRTMAEGAEHPIATPKGAVALTAVVTVISVLAPFLFDVGGALLFGALATSVIVWVYWGDAAAAIAERRWKPHLMVPLVAISVIIGMTVLAARNVSHKPKAPPAITARDLGAMVDAAIKRDFPPPPPPKTTIVTVPGRTIVLKVPAAPNEAPVPAPVPTPAPPASGVSATVPVAAVAKIQTPAAPIVSPCFLEGSKLTVDIVMLDLDGAGHEDEFRKKQDDQKLANDYDIWLAKVETYFVAHKDDLPPITPFEQARVGAWPKPFLLIHESGFHTWRKFEAKRKALESIEQRVTDMVCLKAVEKDTERLSQDIAKDKS